MRPLFIQVPRGKGKEIVKKAKMFNGKNISMMEGTDDEKEIDVIMAYISNREVEGFISEANEIPELKITLFPQGVMALFPPVDQAPEQVTEIEMRSPIEIFLSGLQSKGSWKGFIGYAIIASIVVWIGLFTNTSYLLVAAMLIAPYAGPAMNTAIATARGDWILLRQGMLRYFIALFITIIGTFLLSLLMQQEIATTLMVDRSQISSVALLLALSAGAAGAFNLIQSERDSLVSGAATGMLVAASLAPPAGIIGMAMAIGKWEMVTSGVFLLILQLIGINLTGSIVFRIFGLTSEGPRYNRGKKKIFKTSIAITILALAGSMYWQFYSNPEMQRSSRSQRANAEIQQIVEKNENVNLVESNVRFTRADIEGQNTLLCVIYVQKKEGKADIDEAELKKNLTSTIQTSLLNSGFNVTPLVDVVVLDSP